MVLRQAQQRTKRAAFTLMEIIVVVAIILILAGAGIVVFTGVLSGSKESRAKLDVKSIEKAVQVYTVKYGRAPGSLQELTTRMPDNSPALLKPEALTDPWDQPYGYDPSQAHPTTDVPLIWSNGDPVKGGQGKITNWDIK
jgi:general secretion pathway protein G